MLASGTTFPRRRDSSAVVGTSLLPLVSGLRHRRVAELVGLPHTTGRDWFRHAHANAGRSWQFATRWTLELTATGAPFAHLDATPLALRLETVGHSTASWVRRFRPIDEPWHPAVVLTARCYWHPHTSGRTGTLSTTGRAESLLRRAQTRPRRRSH